MEILLVRQRKTIPFFAYGLPALLGIWAKTVGRKELGLWDLHEVFPHWILGIAAGNVVW